VAAQILKTKSEHIIVTYDERPRRLVYDRKSVRIGILYQTPNAAKLVTFLKAIFTILVRRNLLIFF
jgi:hypothetical protein